MNNDTEVSIRFRNSVTGEKKLKEYSETLTKIRSVISGIDKGMLKEIETTADQTKEINKTLEKMDKKVNLAFNYTAVRTFARAMMNLTKAISKSVSASASYLENMNLLDVAFNNNTKEADKFVNKLSEMYGLDESWGYRTVGIFKQLANAMGVSAEAGDKLSTILTQLSIDTASLYNIDTSDAVSIFSSALAGQTKPARRLGADITQSTLQTTLDNAGIERYIANLGYAEKRLLIVASLLQQLQQANNDWGRTIESVANQTRILHEQWNRLTRAIGNVFLPLVRTLLPYLNAILMVLVEIINSIAVLFGYNPSDFDFFTELDESVVDLADGLGTASENAKKLKQGLRSFDKLNNITTPSANTSGVGGGLGTGIDPSIMDLFNKEVDKYNSKLTNIQMKATKIRDKIMEWLGYIKQIDPVTGAVSFKLKEGLQRIHLIAGAIGVIVGFKLIKGITGLITGTSNLGKALGTGGLYKIITNLVKQISKIGLKGTLTKLITQATTKLKAFLPVATKVVSVLGGLVLTITGSKGINKAMKEMVKDTDKSGKAFGNYTKSVLETVAGATMIGSVFGPLGTVVGALTGVVIAGVSAWNGYKQAIYELAKEDVFGTLNISLEQWTNILNNSNTGISNFGTKLEELREKLDGYGENFKASQDALDLYGYKFGVIGQKISQEDAVNIQNAIQSMVENSSKMIEENSTFSLSIWGETFSKMNTITEDEEKAILTNISNYGEKQKKELKQAQDNITKTYNNAIKTRGYLTDEEYKYIQTQLAKIRQLTQTEMSKNQANIEYYKNLFSTKNAKLDEESYKNFNNALQNYNKEQQTIIEENYRILLQDAEWYRKNVKNGEEEYQKMVKTANEQRIKEEESLKTQVEGIQKSVLTSLADKYLEVKNKTDLFSKDQKKIIENVFKDLKIDTKDIEEKFASAGARAKQKFLNNAGGSYNIKTDFSFTVQKGMYTGKTLSPFPYADGGLPPVGQVFVANEKGAELVGNIGGQSFVANQNQMMDLLDKKIGNAQTSKTPQVYNIYLDKNNKIATYTLEQLEGMAKTNGKPITIGG